MARPIRETPVLKGEDAFNFEWRRLTVEHHELDETRSKSVKVHIEVYSKSIRSLFELYSKSIRSLFELYLR